MDRRSVSRYVVDAFQAKFVLEVVEEGRAASRACAIYRLFSFREILRRLRAANCMYAKKNGKAVYLVRPLSNADPVTEPQVTTSRPNNRFDTSTVDVFYTPSVFDSQPPTVGKTSTVGDTPTESMGDAPTGAIDVFNVHTLLGSKKKNSLGENVVVDELETIVPLNFCK